jgi:dTDP-4-dehydrorhamnose reductase
MSSCTVLITGGSGLLALNWALTYREQHRVVLGLHSRHVALRGVEVCLIDLGTVEGVVKALDLVQPNVVIHTAGLTSVEQCQADPMLARHVNVTLAINVAQACNKRGVTLIHISTDHLFSGEKSEHDEAEYVSPLNEYAQTKAEAERCVAAACPTALIIRTNFYGWGTRYRNSFSDTILQALRSGQPISLFTDVFYTPIIASVLATTCHELVNSGQSGVFNVAGDRRVSKYEFGRAVARSFGLDEGFVKPGQLSDVRGLVRRPRDMSLSTKLVTSVLGHGLGCLSEHLQALRRQEEMGLVNELRAI